MRKSRTVKGSFTVEAAMLAPVFFLVIFSAIHLQLYMFEKAWNTTVQWEETITQATEQGVLENTMTPTEYIQKVRAAKGWLGKD